MTNYAVAIAHLENQSVSERTKERYHSTNFHFILFLAKEYPDSLRIDLLASINAVKTHNLTVMKEEKEL
jgi:hypothetical protein